MTDRESDDDLGRRRRPSLSPDSSDRPTAARPRSASSGGTPIIIPVRSGSGSGRAWHASKLARLALGVILLAIIAVGVMSLLRPSTSTVPAVKEPTGAMVNAPTPAPSSPAPTTRTTAPATTRASVPTATAASTPTTTPTTTPAAVPKPTPAATAPASTAAPAPAPQAGLAPASDADARVGVAGALDAYASAIDTRDADAIALAFPSISPDVRGAWRSFFLDVASMDARLVASNVRRTGPDRADADVAGTYSYSAGTPPRRVRKAITFTGGFVRDRVGAWHLDAVR
jgi:hypothetical protein